MAEIINFKSKNSWDSFQDLSDASPAKNIITKATEIKINKFNIEGRLKNINSKLGSVAIKNATKSERLAA